MTSQAPGTFPVNTNAMNTLGVRISRLPIGIPTPVDAGTTWWRIWVPTKAGGELKITHNNDGKLFIERPLKTPVTDGTAELSLTIVPGAHGEYFLKCEGKGGLIRCNFEQVAWSREGPAPTDAPLIPWNFWYWPYLDVVGGDGAPDPARDPAKAPDILARYGRAVNKGRIAERYREWEARCHRGTESSEGHCHNAAPASALFECPPDSHQIGTAVFTRAEMKLFATEFVGTYGLSSEKWNPKSRDAVDVGQLALGSYFRPGAPKTEEALLRALTYEIGPERAATRVAEVTLSRGRGAAFTESIRRLMGFDAATLYDTLVTEMLGNGQPLLGNFRAYELTGNPCPVWNHIAFHYRAEYAETTGTHDEKDITITANVYVNRDSKTCPDFPATVSVQNSRNIVVPGTSSLDCLRFRHVWRIIFEANGSVAPSDVRCDWLHLTNDKGTEIFPPTSLDVLIPSQTSPKPLKESSLGNPIVGLEFPATGAVAIRGRFR